MAGVRWGDMESPVSPIDAPGRAVAEAAVALRPQIASVLTPALVLERLEREARRGKLPGYVRAGASGFVIDADAIPFEGRVCGTIAGTASGTAVSMAISLKPAMPWGFFVVLVLAAWPGVLLTESFLRAVLPGWGWLHTTTWYWYFPLAVVSIPLVMIPAVRRSRTGAAASGAKISQHVATMLEQG